MSKDAEISQRIYLKDYAPPDYTITRTELHLNLDRTRTRVHARLTVGTHLLRKLIRDLREVRLLIVVLYRDRRAEGLKARVSR